MATPVSFDPSTYTATAEAPFTLGARYTYLGREFRFLLNANGASDNAIADGDVLLWASASAYTVCNALNGVGSALALNPPAAVGTGVAAKNKYFFALTKGRHTNVKSTSSSAGVLQKQSATAATCTDQTAATIGSIGLALTATSGGRCTVEVNL